MFSVLFSFNLSAADKEKFQQERLEHKVKFESISHHDRIAILKEADICINSAKTNEEYRACEEAEKAGRKESKDKIFTMRKTDILEKLSLKKSEIQNGKALSRIERLEGCVKKASQGKQLKQCFKRRKG